MLRTAITVMSRMPRAHHLAALLLALAVAFAGPLATRALANDQPGQLFLPSVTTGMPVASALDAAAHGDAGAVYVLTNQAGGNAVAVFRRSAGGQLEAAGAVPTGGLGTGSGLGSQGALVLSDNGRWLFAVNAGSGDISLFAVQPDGLALMDRVPSGGIRPTSITVHQDLVYVLNAGGSGNITAFRLENDGHLAQLLDSSRTLSNGGVGNAPAPAQVSFSPDGKLLVVTERATSLLLTYGVDSSGLASGPTIYPSAGTTPFGFAFSQQGTLVVSEAFGGAPDASAVSSYVIAQGSLQTVSASIPTGQTAACWVAVTKNGKYAYSANAGSSSVSAYAVQPDGSLSLLDGRAGVTGNGAGPIDVMISHNGQYLYVLNGRVPNVAIFAVEADGGLTNMGVIAGLPAGVAGIAAW